MRLILFAAIFMSIACAPNQRILDSAKENERAANLPAANRPVSDLESDLAAMRDAEFYHVYVLRRKDGATLDADDKRFVGGVTTAEINRRLVSDGGKAIILGSNYKLTPEILKLLTQRFAFEDLSRPESEMTPKNANTNS